MTGPAAFPKTTSAGQPSASERWVSIGHRSYWAELQISSRGEDRAKANLAERVDSIPSLKPMDIP
jgi:hypothetical protein